MTENSNTPREGKQVALSQATKEQLRDFLTELGGKHTNFDTEQRLREKIYGMNWDKPFITIYEEDPRSDGAAPGVEDDLGNDAPVSSGPIKVAKEPMVEIRIGQQGDAAAGKRPIFVGVNGVGILLPRNIPILVKHRYYSVLRNAVETQFNRDETTGELESSDVQSYPFEVLRMPPDSELKAWSDYKAALQARDAARHRMNRPQHAA